MRYKFMTVVAALAALGFMGTAAQSAPQIGAAAIGQAAPDSLVKDVAIRRWRGHAYCFYFNGWRGPGWYRCGAAWRRGYGWGGVYGWNSWYYGPAYHRYGRRYHHRRGRTYIRSHAPQHQYGNRTRTHRSSGHTVRRGAHTTTGRGSSRAGTTGHRGGATPHAAPNPGRASGSGGHGGNRR